MSYYDTGYDEYYEDEYRINSMVEGFNPSAPDSLSEALGNSDLTCLAPLIKHGQGDATLALRAVRMIAEMSHNYWYDYAVKVLARKESK